MLYEPASRGAGTVTEMPTTAVSARRRRHTDEALIAGAGSKEGVAGEPKAETNAVGGGHVAHTLDVTASLAYLEMSRRSCSALASTCTAARRGLVTVAAVKVSSNITNASGTPEGDGDAPLLSDPVGELETEGVMDGVAGGVGEDVPETLAPRLPVGVGVIVLVGEPEAVTEALADSVDDAVGVPELDGELDGDAPLDTEDVGVAVWELVPVGVGVLVGDAPAAVDVPEGVSDEVTDAPAAAEGEIEPVGVGEPVGDTPAAGVEDSEGVDDGVEPTDSVSVADATAPPLGAE